MQSGGLYVDMEASDGAAATLDGQIAEFERRVLTEALRRNGGSKSAAGRELGVSPRMMTYRLKKAGIV
jgi:Nif-specific regulatory protein